MAQQALARRPVVLLLGDSLTERGFDPDGGWAAALAHALTRRADVANRGLSGWNSRWALKAARRLCRGALGLPLPSAKGQVAAAVAPGTCAADLGVEGLSSASSAAAAPPPKELLFATVWFGANDAALPDRGGKLQHVPVDEYARNLEAIAREAIAAAAEANAAAAASAAAANATSSPTPRPVRLLVLTPPPVGDVARTSYQRQRMRECGDPQLARFEGKPLEEGPLPDRTLGASRAYADAALAVAERLRREFGRGGANADAANGPAAAAAANGGGAKGGAPAIAAPGPATPTVIVASVDLHSALTHAVEADGGWGKDLFTDGLHFTGQGATAVGKLIVAAAERPADEGGLGLGPLQQLPAHLPLWDRLAAPGWETALDEFFA
jgi:lysophospholipase L1-like esterase